MSVQLAEVTSVNPTTVRIKGRNADQFGPCVVALGLVVENGVERLVPLPLTVGLSVIVDWTPQPGRQPVILAAY